MTEKLANFAARLREYIASSIRLAADASQPTSVNLKSETRNPKSPEPSNTGHHEEDFDALALESFRIQFDHNAAYRRICEARGVAPETVEHWTQIPAAPAAAFKEFELTSLPLAERTTVFHSSGTSGQQPSRHFHSAESLAVYEASLWPWFRVHMLPDWPSAVSNRRSAILTPPPAQAPRSSLIHMFETLRRELGLDNSCFVGRVASDGTWSLDFAALLEALRAVFDSKSSLVLLGTAFLFVHLLDHLAEQALRFQLPPGSRVMETGGYKGRSRSLSKSELHALITERLGVPASHIVCEYGMSELSSQAYDRVLGLECQVSGRATFTTQQARRSFHFPPWARVQIISPESGLEVAEDETGLIRVFDLANVFSVLAIQTEDLGISRDGGFEPIGRVPLAEPRGCSLTALNP